ncbi:insulinase family protein [Nitrincola alkalilacustris]|uniref:insulinase family protein n=1 Tax=Nitrincola alkalilacustris TaxID=1571224 RepID=UPI0014577DB1|nr:insulinase family protein [Nitrincola alkalilacustris]
MHRLTGLNRFIFTLLALLLLNISSSQAHIITSPYDTREYETLVLDNQLKVLLVSDPSAEKAAASLDVGVGSGANPVHRPGLAHFLEHMLFLGTEPYPEADGYQHYISANGGNHNAFTAYENTNYFFDIQPQAFEGALDRFAAFFTYPLFSPEYVERERHAVESEFQARRRDDRRRAHEVSKAIMNPDHHFSRFAVGDLASLSDQPGQSIRDELIEFYNRYYSANLMSLVVLGPQSLDELRELVTERFGKIRNFDAEPFIDEAPLYSEGTLPALLDIQTLRQTRSISLSFPVEPTKPHWEKRPLYYIASLVGYEGEGSLLSLLKAEGLANGLGAYSGLDLENSATFDVAIDLTEKGFEDYERVVELFFAFIEELRLQGVQSWIFEEEKALADLQFQFRESRQPIHEVTTLAQIQQRYPTQHLLNAGYYFGEFDADLIHRYLDRITPEQMLLTRQAQDLETDQTEVRYNVGYRVTQIQPEQLTRWQAPQSNQALAVRSSNRFIPTDLSLVEREQATDTPELLLQEPGVSLWFQQDQQFELPRSDFFFALMSRPVAQSTENAVMTDLYIRMVNDELNEPLYDAMLAGLSASLYPHLRGFSLRLSGYSPKQPLLLDELLLVLQNPTADLARFDRVKRQMQESLINQAQEAPTQLSFQKLYTLLMTRWSTEEKLAALEEITLQDLLAFIPVIYEKAELRMLAHGNLTNDTARNMATRVAEQLIEEADEGFIIPVIQLPADEPLIETLDLAHHDAVLNLYLQGRNSSIEERAAVALLNEIISTPFYSELRTEKQFGYIVFSNYLPLRDVPGISLVVQSSVADPLELMPHFTDFLVRMRELISDTSDESLEQFRQSLRSRLLQPDNTLADRSARYWRELDRDGSFTTHIQIADAVSQLDRETLLETLHALQKRQLILRHFGSEKQEEISDEELTLTSQNRIDQLRTAEFFVTE